MKKALISFTVVFLLSIASAGYAERSVRHDRQRVSSDYKSPGMIKLFFGSGRYWDFRGERHRPRYVEKRIYKDRGPYGEKVVIKKKIYRRGYDRPYWKKWKRHRHERNNWFERRRWRDRY